MSLAPVWLLLGPEAGLKADFLDNIRKDLAKRGPVEESKYYVSEKDPGDLVSDLQSGSLFGAQQFILYAGIDQVKAKGELSSIVAYCKRPSPDTILCLISDATQVASDLKSAIPQDAQKIFWEMFEDQKESWVRAFFKRESIEISQEAIETILELVENNTQALKDECSRLAFFFRDNGTIADADIEAYVSHNREEDAFSLFDRMVSGDLETAFGTLSKILFSKESEPIGILAGLAWSFRRLYDFHALREDFPEDQAFIRLGIKSKTVQGNVRRASKLWSGEDCTRILGRCADTDAAIRSGGSTLSAIQLECFIYSVMRKAGHPLEKDQYDIA